MSTPSVSDAHRTQTQHLNPPARLLLGPGPCNMPPNVNLMLASPMLGHMDPAFFKIMDSTQELLRYVFQTNNAFTIPLTGAGSAAMECCLANLIEPGDVVLVCIAGYFASRIHEMAERYGADLRRLDGPWGEAFSAAQIEEAVRTHKPRLVCIVHGETSTGIRQDVAAVGDIAKRHGALLMVDTVASMGGVPFFVDAWGVDACYTGGQKCLSGPPGISPVTFSERAMERIRSRKSPIANWYLDANLLASYWLPAAGQPRKYHHTGSANLVYALHEALLTISAEGLENTWHRHAHAAELLYKGLEDMGIQPMISDRSVRLASLTSVSAPQGVNTAQVQKKLLEDYSIEVAGGLGPLAGKIWRVGLMGYNARPSSVRILLSALKDVLARNDDAQKN